MVIIFADSGGESLFANGGGEVDFIVRWPDAGRQDGDEVGRIGSEMGGH